jgi:DNA-binding winged helix-turn-helix (wHTH) protein
MSNQNLIIYKLILLYDILEELSLNLNYNIRLIEDENSLNQEIKNYNNYLVVSKKKYPNISNQFVLENKPIKISKLIEKINIEFLKIKFNNQSQVKVKKYTIDLNSREMLIYDIKLKLTEKEINTITYLSNSNGPVSIEELQKMVWSYQSNIETHTVETHIYRLRKKILNTFDDNEFIISKKHGYQIKSEKSNG